MSLPPAPRSPARGTGPGPGQRASTFLPESPGPAPPAQEGAVRRRPEGPLERLPSILPSFRPPAPSSSSPVPRQSGPARPRGPHPSFSAQGLGQGCGTPDGLAAGLGLQSRPPVSASSRRAVQVPLSVKPLGCATSKPAGPRGPGSGSVTPVPERPDVLPGLRPPCSASRQRRPTRASGGGRGWLGYCLSGSFWGRGH